jgi:hypothetical protein
MLVLDVDFANGLLQEKSLQGFLVEAKRTETCLGV